MGIPQPSGCNGNEKHLFIMNNTVQTLKYEGLTFLRVSDRYPFHLDQIKPFDGVVIEFTEKKSSMELVKNIRSHNQQSVYLTPLFLYRLYGEPDKLIARLVDGTTSNLGDLKPIADITRKIKSRM